MSGVSTARIGESANKQRATSDEQPQDAPERVARLKARAVPLAGVVSPLGFQRLTTREVVPFVPLCQIVRDKVEQSGTFFARRSEMPSARSQTCSVVGAIPSAGNPQRTPPLRDATLRRVPTGAQEPSSTPPPPSHHGQKALAGGVIRHEAVSGGSRLVIRGELERARTVVDSPSSPP